jgi:hypothetical protein
MRGSLVGVAADMLTVGDGTAVPDDVIVRAHAATNRSPMAGDNFTSDIN